MHIIQIEIDDNNRENKKAKKNKIKPINDRSISMCDECVVINKPTKCQTKWEKYI